MDTFWSIMTALWVFLPVGIANAVPPIGAKIPVLKDFNAPLDFNLEFGGKRLFGAHKTFRGLIIGIIFAILTVILQKALVAEFDLFPDFIDVDYGGINPIIMGTLSALGALLGDAVESSIKRRIGIEPGGKWVPFDQIDFIIGGIIFTYLVVQLNLLQYLAIFFIYLVLHRLVSIIGYLLKIKDVPY